MGKNMANVNSMLVKVKYTDQSEMITTNIKYDIGLHPICGTKGLFQLREVFKNGRLHNLMPSN
jgi:hypothetical protein